MPDYKHYMNNGMRGCRLIAYKHDPHRNRDVRAFAVPGQFDVVLLTDGVDSWVCPAMKGHPYFDDYWQLLNKIANGEPIPPPTPIVHRARVRAAAEPQPDPEPARKRVRIQPADYQPRRERRAAL